MNDHNYLSSMSILMRRAKAILVDADDTLWYDGIYFIELRNSVIKLFRSIQGYASSEGRLDHEVLRLREKAGEEGYLSALRTYSRTFNIEAGTLERLDVICDQFRNRTRQILPGVDDVGIGDDRYKWFLVTKGIESEQMRKLDHFDLGGKFTDVIVAEKKTIEVWTNVVSRTGVQAGECVVIGNSLRNDVIPGLTIGTAAIWLNHEHNAFGRDAARPPKDDERWLEVSSWNQISSMLKNGRDHGQS